MICSLNVIIVVKVKANFLKFIDQKKYEQYLLERYKGSALHAVTPKFDFKPTKFKDIDYFSKLKKISELDDEHPKQVVIKRQIPTEYHDKLYLCNKFMSFVNEVKPNTFPHTKGTSKVDNTFTEMMAKHLLFKGAVHLVKVSTKISHNKV